MISFIHESEQAFDTAPMAAKIAKAHAEFTEQKLTEALIAKFGKLPSLEGVAKHCLCVHTPDNVAHYFWFDGEKPKLGEKVDLSQALVAIAPPKIFNPEKPNP